MKIKNIFLADDDSDDIFLFREALKEVTGNVVVHVAENGDVLLKMLASQLHEPDLIFLDLNMPIKNGIDCLKEIKQKDRLKDIAIAIYSTSSSDADVEETFVLGANVYIKKPNDFSELKKVLKEFGTQPKLKRFSTP